MGVHGWLTVGVLAAAAALYAEDTQPPGPRKDAVPDKAVPDKAVPDKAVPDNALPDALKVTVIDLDTGKESSLEEQVRRIRQRKAEETPTIEQLGALYRTMMAEKPLEQRQAEGRKLLRSLDELITTMPICDDDVLARQMLDFGKAGDLYLGLEQYPKAVRAYMEAIKRSYRSEAEALRQGNEKDASAHEIARVQALRGMSLAWYNEGKRSANSTYSHALYGRAMDARSSARDLLVARKKDGRSSGTAKESIVDDLLRLGGIASDLKDDRSVAVYARLATEEMKREQEEKRREQQEKQLRKELSLARIYQGAVDEKSSGRDLIETLDRIDVLIRGPQQ